MASSCTLGAEGGWGTGWNKQLLLGTHRQDTPEVDGEKNLKANGVPHTGDQQRSRSAPSLVLGGV